MSVTAVAVAVAYKRNSRHALTDCETHCWSNGVQCSLLQFRVQYFIVTELLLFSEFEFRF
jgi:hypothetical protein